MIEHIVSVTTGDSDGLEGSILVLATGLASAYSADDLRITMVTKGFVTSTTAEATLTTFTGTSTTDTKSTTSATRWMAKVGSTHDALAGYDVIRVSSAEGFSAGDKILISGGGVSEERMILAIALPVPVLVLEAPLENSYSAEGLSIDVLSFATRTHTTATTATEMPATTTATTTPRGTVVASALADVAESANMIHKACATSADPPF